LGSIACRRRCLWFAPTSALLAVLTRCNTNVQCNYRLPINEDTHDPHCQRVRCTENLKKLTRIAQKAMKQMTGYFSGYFSKKQLTGQFELKKTMEALPSLKQTLMQRPNQSASSHLAQVVNRTVTALEGKGILRAAAEEFLLATRFKKHDELSAEFIRTFRHREFPGKNYLQRYHAIKHEVQQEVSIFIPKGPFDKTVSDDVSLYGFRPCHPNTFFLSPWMFWQWFFAHKLRPPAHGYHLTQLTEAGSEKMKLPQADRQPLELAVDFVVNDSFIKKHDAFYAFPDR